MVFVYCADRPEHLVGWLQPRPPTIFENGRDSGSAALGLDPDENLDDPAACYELGRCTCEGLETSRFNHGCFRSTRVVFLSTSSLLRHAGIHGYMFSAENSDSSDSAEIVYSVSGLKLKEMRA